MNPDWDKLEACQQSLREHMSEIERLKSDLDEWRRECRAEIERLKDMEQAYLEEVKLRLELEVEIERLREAAQAVVERWHTPLWKDVEATAAVINRLERALEPPQS